MELAGLIPDWPQETQPNQPLGEGVDVHPASLLAKPDSYYQDERSFAWWARIHANSCQHSWEEFLTWQLARRIQHQLTEELQTVGIANVGRCGGKFQDGEFAFTLDVASVTPGSLDEATIQQVFTSSSNVIAKVLSSYRFQGFETVRLIHASTGRSLLLPKTRLELLR